ncbi:L-threonylcarbamoyladenylate synthase [Acaricomes phytoseiuli]|uniref:L-threonylcarbamoyladenylate synthase n=1 Tax=Acaricomes phytoseiuli TaxID=291968 RepID=UPI00037C0313|nr:L-threonylcarbamoyladenylate synthase [Acaricomes phytoseiuli]MCW1248717.1 L-threonylcarbamoyladenylate synthase [Acaricomes phytoseiuli]
MSGIVYDCTVPAQRHEGLEHARKAISQKQIVVMPTDTVYGVAADAFSPVAVATLLAAKGRGRSMPPPVLIQRLQTLDGLAAEVSDEARQLAEAFWPGALTMIFYAHPTLDWDLGDTKGTVALRMPDDQLALDLLTLTGPLAVSSANRTGEPTARTAAGTKAQLGGAVEAYLGDGDRPADGAEPVPSTIVDATGGRLRVVRLGGITLEQLREIVPNVLGIGEEPEPAESDAAEPASAEPEQSEVEPAGTGVASDSTGPAEHPSAQTPRTERPEQSG